MSKDKINSISPLDALVANNIKSPFYERKNNIVNSQKANTEDLRVDPSECAPWKYHDRNDIWLTYAKCKDLIESIKKNGQKVPIFVREKTQKDSDIKYEIIAGKRRWFASKYLQTPVLIKIIKASDKDCSILMHLENHDRKDLSDFERAISCKQQIVDKIFISKTEMSTALSISTSQLDRMLKAADIVNYDFVKDFINSFDSQPGIKYCYQLVQILKASSDAEQKLKVYIKKNHEELLKNKINSCLKKMLEIFKQPLEIKTKFFTDNKNKVVFKGKLENNKVTLNFELSNKLSKTKILQQCKETVEYFIDK